jgi:GH24 family phage-related lysozyme (muramidase)
MLFLSQDGIDLIHAFEGCRLRAYDDGAKYPTIGWGHRIWPEETERFKNGLTQEEADALFLVDKKKAENHIHDLVHFPLNQNQFDALVDFAYNAGAQNLRTSTLLKKINASDFKGAANEFGKWVFGGGKKLNGLVKRRDAERLLFEGYV